MLILRIKRYENHQKVGKADNQNILAQKYPEIKKMVKMFDVKF